jgi:diguanylate cyclase (GGDEF)-like protein/PAS domain S-box-containing protein
MNMQFTYISPSIKRHLDYTPAEASAHTLSEILTPASLETAMKVLGEEMGKHEKGQRDPKPITLELEVTHKDGSTIPAEIRANFMFDSADQPTGVIGIMRDITERKLAEKQLIESEMRFRSVAESANDAIISCNSKERISFWNTSAQKMFGYTEKEVMGQTLTTLMPEQYREAHKEGIKIYVSTGESKVIGKTVELTGLRKGGNEFPLELSLSTWKTREEVFFTAMIRDITDRKQAEQTLQESEKRYRELSIVDDLTKLYNSRYFYSQLKTEVERASRYNHSLSLLMMDIDDFKHFNDTYGHLEGNKILTKLGEVIRECLRKTDSAYRYGGEEFTVILPETEAQKATSVAERIRKRFEAETFSPTSDETVHVTISIGLARYLSGVELSEFIRSADKAMYVAKEQGKNRIFYSR